MSKRCPDCGFVNEDSRIYCSSCGEPLDAELRLMKELNEQASGHHAPAKKEIPVEEDAPRVSRSSSDDDDYVHHKMAKEKKSSPVPWVLLALGVVAVIVGIMILGQ